MFSGSRKKKPVFSLFLIRDWASGFNNIRYKVPFIFAINDFLNKRYISRNFPGKSCSNIQRKFEHQDRRWFEREKAQKCPDKQDKIEQIFHSHLHTSKSSGTI